MPASRQDLLLRETAGATAACAAYRPARLRRCGGVEPGRVSVAPMLPDMPAQAYRQMLCVEAARISEPVLLQAGQRWQGMQQLRVMV